MSKRSASKSTTLPLPSSPHCAPRTIMFCMETRPRAQRFTRPRARKLSLYQRGPRSPASPFVTISLMELRDIFLRLGEDTFAQLMRTVSLGRLRTYQLFDPFKTRMHLHKLNAETLRKATPRVWARLGEADAADLAAELAQAILVSHMDMIKAVLDELGVPHDEGFFAKHAEI